MRSKGLVRKSRAPSASARRRASVEMSPLTDEHGQDARRDLRLQRADDGEAVAMRHVQIEDDQVGRRRHEMVLQPPRRRCIVVTER